MCAEEPRPSVEAGKRMYVEKCRNTRASTIRLPSFYHSPDVDCAVVVDILQFGSTALFDVGVDVDPSDNNNIVGVIRTPQPHSHLTAPSLFSPPSQPAKYKVCCPKLNYFIQFPTLSHSLHCQQTRRGRRWSAGNASVTSSSLVYEEIQVISNKLTPQSFTSYTS